MLAVPVAAGDHSLAGLDLLDQPFLAAGAGRPEPDPVAHGDHVPAVDGQALEQPADVAGERPAVVGLDDGEQPWMRTTRPARQVFVSTVRRAAAAPDDSSHWLAGCVSRSTSVDDRPMPRQVSLGPDALARAAVSRGCWSVLS